MHEKLFQLDGRVVVVTGGAGHLGREISRGLADFGAHVIAVGRNPERFAELQNANIECVKCDVQDEANATDGSTASLTTPTPPNARHGMNSMPARGGRDWMQH